MFVSGRKRDLNIRAAYVHMAADAAVSVGVVITGFAIMFSGWLWLDPLISLVIVAIVLLSTWDSLRASLHPSVDDVPEEIDTQVRPGMAVANPSHLRAGRARVFFPFRRVRRPVLQNQRGCAPPFPQHQGL